MTGFVTVACKLPNGLWLRAFEPTQEPEVQRDGGTKTLTIHRETGRFRINGNAIPKTRDPNREYPNILGGPLGYALTPGVPAELWAAWLEKNKDAPMVRQKLIFASEKMDMVRGEARECEGVKSGLEPLAKDGDIRMPRKLSTFRAA